ncbi:MAG: PrsW family intramembrane metalloprotease [Eubacterium sp.]|nr:PrsW family intramembrane metalloprotease [Eubacterium sp.]
MFLLLLPGIGFLFIILLAILPAALLMHYVYRQDKIEKEPPALLRKLILMGVLAAFLSMLLESIGERLLSLAPIDPDSPLYMILTAFLVVAVVEEGAKYFLMHRCVWKHPAFDYRFDAIIYAVFTSLGFAAMENVMYVLGFGLSVVLARALLSIPAHMSFSVVFGVFYGRARKYANRGQMAQSRMSIFTGFLLAVFFHGFYDSCAMIGSTLSMILFALFMIVIYATVFFVVKSESRTDSPV